MFFPKIFQIMKKLLFLVLIVLLASCSHDHKKDKVIGNVHDIYLKEVNKMKADISKEQVAFRKKIIDSMNVAFKKAPEGKGWYSSKEMKLPSGVCIDFNPDELTAKTGPYYIIIRGFDGKQSINKVDRERWLLLQRGDVIK